MKRILFVFLMLLGTTSAVQADAPGYDPSFVVHTVRANKLYDILQEAQKKGEFLIVMNRDKTTHRYLITRSLGYSTLCYRHESWPGAADRCEFTAEMAARFARDWTIEIH